MSKQEQKSWLKGSTERFHCMSMSDPLSTKVTEITHRSVVENGLDRDDEEVVVLLSEGAGCSFACVCVRGAVREGAVEDAAARLIAAIAAADAALVWCCHAFTPLC